MVYSAEQVNLVIFLQIKKLVLKYIDCESSSEELEKIGDEILKTTG